jgi:uncharacterized iron-regulated protein
MKTRTLPFGPSLAALLLITSPGAAQDAPPDSALVPDEDFRVYHADGREASLDDIVAAVDGVDVLLVGEEHGNRVGHRLEEAMLRGVVERLRGTPRWVTLSMEMFERDVQYIVDEYLAGVITEDHFLDSARPWEDYATRYRPLVELARAEGFPVVAANAPRRYVNRVTREGPDALSNLGPLARFYMPPLPYPGPSAAYRAQWDSIMAAALASMPEGPEGAPSARSYAGSENALHAQALWDAAMGHAIVEAMDVAPGAVIVHFAGSFHVERGTGIPERIEDYRSGTRVATVVMTRPDDGDLTWRPDQHTDLGDFVILTR